MTFRVNAGGGGSPVTFGPFSDDGPYVTPPVAADFTIDGYTTGANASDVAGGTLLEVVGSSNDPSRTLFGTTQGLAAGETLLVNIRNISGPMSQSGGSMGLSLMGLCDNGKFFEFQWYMVQNTSGGLPGIYYGRFNSFNNKLNGWGNGQNNTALFARESLWMSLYNPPAHGAMIWSVGNDRRYMQPFVVDADNSLDAGGITSLGFTLQPVASPVQVDTKAAIIVQSWEKF